MTFCQRTSPGKAIQDPKFGVYIIYIYVTYTPKLGLRVAASVWEREQGCFRESREGLMGRSKGALREC